MTREEAFDKIRSLKSILPAASDEIDDILDVLSGESCEGSHCESAQDDYACYNNIELED